jgi:hypothetical protein
MSFFCTVPVLFLLRCGLIISAMRRVNDEIPLCVQIQHTRIIIESYRRGTFAIGYAAGLITGIPKTTRPIHAGKVENLACSSINKAQPLCSIHIGTNNPFLSSHFSSNTQHNSIAQVSLAF